MEEMAIKLVGALIHTPVDGVGLNFGFTEEVGMSKLSDLFRIDDMGAINDIGLTVENTAIVRKLVLNDEVLNFRIETERGQVKFDFNYHYDATEASQIAEKIRGRMVVRKNEATEFLRRVYALEIDIDEGSKNDK